MTAFRRKFKFSGFLTLLTQSCLDESPRADSCLSIGGRVDEVHSRHWQGLVSAVEEEEEGSVGGSLFYYFCCARGAHPVCVSVCVCACD